MNLLWRILYRSYRIGSGLRYWVQRRFTPAGVGVLVAFVIATVMGPDSENNVAYQAFALLLLLLVLAAAFSLSFRARFSAYRALPRFGTVGTPLRYRVFVKNLGQRPQRSLTLLEKLADPRPSFQEWRAAKLAYERRVRSFRVSNRPRVGSFRIAHVEEALVPPLLPGEEGEAHAELVPLRRGVLRFEGLTIARTDPFGLYRAFAKVQIPQTALILPRRYPLPPIALPGTMKYQAGGISLASNVGRSEEFVALRDYRHGDPLRHIHWRSWAKAGKPVVREFEDEFFVRHALVLDTFTDHPQSEIFEEAVSVAASFACSVRTQESLLDLLFVGPDSYCFTSGRGLARSEQMLEVLASVRPCWDTPFGELENLVMEHVQSVSGCICVLLDWDKSRRDFVKKLRTIGMPVLVLVIVPPGEKEKPQPGPMADDPGQFHVLEMGNLEACLARLK
ncbi:MAG TPA: DUF58 domain-containing protein [Candidatus Dormibacteraeota bacterium]|nr:DUF58 domain-containing protein [Candidatus Dormibacteraeota bacterium]